LFEAVSKNNHYLSTADMCVKIIRFDIPATCLPCQKNQITTDSNAGDNAIISKMITIKRIRSITMSIILKPFRFALLSATGGAQ